jgi:hypothetical protein
MEWKVLHTVSVSCESHLQCPQIAGNKSLSIDWLGLQKSFTKLQSHLTTCGYQRLNLGLREDFAYLLESRSKKNEHLDNIC